MTTLEAPPKTPLLANLTHRETVSRWDKLLVALLIGIPLGATLFAMYAAWRWTDYLHAKDLVLLGVFYLFASLGITVGFHRMLTHTAFEAPWFVRGMLLIFAMWGLEGSPISWAAVHIKHHAYSDKEEDPHSPLQGFWHAHMGWLFTVRVDPVKYAPKQMQDPVVRFIARTAGWWALLGILLPFAIGGWTGLLWASGVRIFLVHHVTWSVNSICHTFGSRPFRTGADRSTNNLLVGILGMGEGWHNNHHAFPRSAFHGLRLWEFDASGYFIQLLGKLGLAKNIIRVPDDVVQARREQGTMMSGKSKAA
ncbi:MAG: acyl-CoA desaturase [Dehalococcoidia bacterium]|nr:acyl-CoA desaturase [Dehalococcoidia bacterium]